MKKPLWYQEPFVWLLIFFPGAAVIGGIITIFIAIHSNDGLVVDDYYKQGLEINRTLARDKAAASHALQASLHFNYDNQLIRLYLKAHSDYPLPHQITLSFSHRTRTGFDQQIILTYLSENSYQGTLPQLITGGFLVQLAADDWRLLQSMRVPMTQNLTVTF